MNASFNVFAYRGPWMELSWRTCALLTAFTLVFAGFPLTFASAAVVFGSVESAANESSPGNTDSLTIDIPASTVAGDFLLAGIAINGGDEVDVTEVPSGWTLVERTDNDDDVMFATYWKVAGGSEPADYTWEFERDSSDVRAAGGIIRYTGVDTSNPIMAEGENEGNSDIFTAPSVTTTADNTVVVVFYAQDDDADHVTPSGTTERYDVENPNNAGPRTSAADFIVAAAGSSGTKTLDSGNSSSKDWIAQTIALREAEDDPATLTVTKVVTNDNGGTAVVGEFALSVGAESVTSGVAEEFEAGEYSITEDGPEGYSATFTGDCDEDGNIEMDAGGTYECTITNDDVPAELTIVKHTVGGDGDFDFSVGDGTSTSTVELTTVGNEATSTAIELDAGTYSVTEAQQSGWSFTSSSCVGASGAMTIEDGEQITVGIGDEVTCTFTNTELGSFSLVKNSHADEGAEEATLTGPNDFEDTQATLGAGGITEWNEHTGDLVPGSYTLTAEGETIFCDTDSATGTIAFTIGAGEAVECFINNSDYGIIAGQKFEDMNADGNSEGDSGLSGWEIIAERLDDDEGTEFSEIGAIFPATTGEDGNYSIIVPPGEYRVCETAQGGWYQTYPFGESGSETLIPTDNCADDAWGWTFTVTSGTSEEGVVAGVSFGNYQNASVSGYKWNNENANGIWDEGEDGKDGFTIYPDLNENGMMDGDEGDYSDVTDGSGQYLIEGLQPGTYQIRELNSEGWAQTAPTTGYFEVVLSSGEEAEGEVGGADLNFGNVEDATISGVKWEDEDGDGEWDEGENILTGMPDLFTFTLYMQDPENTETPIFIGQTTNNSDGEYFFEGLLPGDYFVQEEPTSGWLLTSPSPAQGYEIELGVNENATDYDFGNTRVNTVSGVKWEDENANGIRDNTEIENPDNCVLGEGDILICTPVPPSEGPQEAGVAGFTIVATPITSEGEEDTEGSRVAKSVVTDEDGNYSFSFLNTEAGWWRISETASDGWTQTYPTLPSYHDVLVEVDSDTEDIDFGNYEHRAASGFKWNDLNENGIWDGGESPEPGILDWFFNALPILGEDGAEDEGRSQKTASSTTGGAYAFSFGLSDFGWWRISEVAQDGWSQTYPTTTSSYEILVATTTSPFTDLNFGNFAQEEDEEETPSSPAPSGGGGSNGPIAGSIPTGGGGGGTGSPTTPGETGAGSGTGSGGGTSGGGANGPVNNGGVFDGTFADAGAGVGGDASGAGTGGAGTEDGGTPTGGEETPTGTGEQEEGNGQVAAAAAAVGDFLSQYWWLILLLILLLGGGYWAWREYFQRAN